MDIRYPWGFLWYGVLLISYCGPPTADCGLTANYHLCSFPIAKYIRTLQLKTVAGCLLRVSRLKRNLF
jgi:hypothetical protein